MGKVHEVKRVYCCEYGYYINKNGQNCCKVEYVTDLDVAMEYENFRLVKDINEIQESIGLGFDVIPVVECDSGIYGYYEVSYIDSLGDLEWFGGYILMSPNTEWKIKDFRDCIERIEI